MRQTANGQQKYYFSDKLKEQLNQISQYPLTVVEAPSGFGKTTAIREYLRNEFSQASCEWYTCMGESVSQAWVEICELFARINSKIAEDMKNLKIPTMDTLFYMKSHLKNLKCGRETYVIIDNYHLVNFNMHRELIRVFSVHENPNLHIIFITQQLDSRQQRSIHNDNIHAIDASSFFFDREGISSLFRMEGFRLMESEVEDVFRSTEGWISAIRLQMINYRETGSFVCQAGIEKLVETAIWNRLTPREKDFMLKVSVFDSFTAHQAVAMLDHKTLPGEIEEELKASDFIRFIPDKRLFIMHSILLDYLRNRFYYHQPKEYQDQTFRKAGFACAVMGQYCIAARFFYQVKAFESILSLPFTRQYLDLHKDEGNGKIFAVMIQECPEEILCRYPFTLIVFAHNALLIGQFGLYERLCRLLHLSIQGRANFTQEEMGRLTGELILLEALGDFNDLSKMKKGYEAVNELLGEASSIIENSMPWFSVFPTALGLFWREPGKLDETLKDVDELKPIYRRFSRGQGAGLGHLIRAEAMLARGEDNEAEILCYKALYEARIDRQTSICIYAELSLARVFILRGDAENFAAAMENIQRYAVEHSDLSTCYMVDICLTIISLLLGIKDYVAPWLYDIENIRKSLQAPVVPFAEILYFKLLLLDKRYNELYAAGQLVLDSLKNPDSKVKYVLLQMYYLILLAAAKHNSGDDLEAGRHLKEALDIAFSDKVYLPFADQEGMGDLLLGRNMRCFHEGRTSCPSFDDLLALCKRQANGIGVIRKALFQNKSPLTPREREIALLAQQRLSAKEIAAKLYISEKTVKSTLGSVYSKLEIHSRSELALREF